MIRVGSLWLSSDHKRFNVLNVEERETGLWVLYNNNNRKYECLIGAFLERFKELSV